MVNILNKKKRIEDTGNYKIDTDIRKDKDKEVIEKGDFNK